MKVKQLISILLMLLLLTACSANTDLDLPGRSRFIGTDVQHGRLCR